MQNGWDSVIKKVGGELPLDLYINFEGLNPFYWRSIFHFLRWYSSISGEGQEIQEPIKKSTR